MVVQTLQQQIIMLERTSTMVLVYADTPAPITNLGVTNIIHNRATFTFDDMNTSTCRVDQLRIKYREVGTTAWSQKNMGSPTGYDPVTGICNSTSRTDRVSTWLKCKYYL